METAESFSQPHRFASVWDAIEDTPAAAANMKLRSSVMLSLSEHLRQAGLNQRQAAELLGVTQPRVSDLMRGKIDAGRLTTLPESLTTPSTPARSPDRV